ncbi:LON peptidase N-terminal domain and RING finger protein 1 isoform X2 [Protopterus annectens]|uniref:LON peptidase N-terminal domain and RING finger protein 1 isoform X2 n=1 Tax=Protopterus annectens TaxID=7888 RepID=UPI001CFA5194|nr:LON peptidase N-terminal domain and RING finger protein 1 isoform X2 [Protopterus annectens]
MSALAGDSQRDQQDVLLQKAESFALGNQLKEALDTYSAALQFGPLAPGQLSSLVNCVLLNYLPCPDQSTPKTRDKSLTCKFECPGCGTFLANPVILPECGHCYCGRCLKKGLWTRCRFCGEFIGISIRARRPNVLLTQLMEKWFPGEVNKVRTRERASELLQEQDYEAVLLLVNQQQINNHTDWILRINRAEAYAGLKRFRAAADELDSLQSEFPGYSEVIFMKAKIMHAMDCVDEALQLYLQCLTIDEDFVPAKSEVEKILCDLLSPVSENVKEGLQGSVRISPHIRSKMPLIHQPEEGSSHMHSYMKSKVTKKSAVFHKAGFSSANSDQIQKLVENEVQEEGLKRVISAPLLCSPDAVALQKRKLSVSDEDLHMCSDGESKHKKQGESSEVSDTSGCRVVPEELIDTTEFECPLCMRLLFEPVTTPCGHSFCKKCLERCLDHTPHCPLCKECLKEYLANRKYCITHLLEELIMQYLPDAFSERQKIFKEETEEFSSLNRNVPIFVCTMAYPTVPCPLHVFEPRYRLMIRRCIESGTKQFGMCVSEPQKGFADCGCMLFIRNVHFLPDGRSVVDTVGGRRFQVLQRGMKDGYWTAHIKYLEDIKVEDEQGLQELRVLHDEVYTQACTWFLNLRSRFQRQILQHFGVMPERAEDIQVMPNGPAWCWWLLAVLPVDPKYQLSVLSMTSLKDRLIKIRNILTYFSRDQPK